MSIGADGDILVFSSDRTATLRSLMRVHYWLVSVVVVACSRPDPSASIPAGWTATQPARPESEAAMCANLATEEWGVSLTRDSTALVVRPVTAPRFGDTTNVAGGRLIAEDLGEFGGDVWWHPDVGPRKHVARVNLHAFIQARDTVWGLTGLAHMSFNDGQLVRFDRIGGQWRMTTVVDLGAAPVAMTPLAGGSILVLAAGRIVRISPGHAIEVLHQNSVWLSTYPASIARDRSGVIFLGMRAGVARLTPTANGYSEDWLVPANCPRRVSVFAECRCVR
jgi:hypothetical protein